jgi:hypothetical protein
LKCFIKNPTINHPLACHHLLQFKEKETKKLEKDNEPFSAHHHLLQPKKKNQKTTTSQEVHHRLLQPKKKNKKMMTS